MPPRLRKILPLTVCLHSVIAAGEPAEAASAGGVRAQAAEAVSPSAEAARAAFDEGLRLFAAAQSHAEKRPTEREEIARRYRAAAQSFVAAWRAGAASSEVFTNAANSFAFAGDTGRAVLFYRRALAVDPGSARARTALEYLRARLPIRKPEAGTGASILRSLFFWHEGLAFSTRRTAFLVLFPAAFACLAAAIWRRRPFRLLGLILLGGSLALLGSLLVDAVGGSLQEEGVVAVEVQGRRGDGLNYSPSHSDPFPPGTEVTVLQERAPPGGSGEPWVRVRLLDGKESWVPAGTVERVLP